MYLFDSLMKGWGLVQIIGLLLAITAGLLILSYGSTYAVSAYNHSTAGWALYRDWKNFYAKEYNTTIKTAIESFNPASDEAAVGPMGIGLDSYNAIKARFIASLTPAERQYFIDHKCDIKSGGGVGQLILVCDMDVRYK